MIRRTAWLFGLCWLVSLTGCADSKEVNAAFNRTRVTWEVFDSSQPDGLRPLPGLELSVQSAWVPRLQGVYATDLLPLAEKTAALAVSRVGLLVLDDSTGVVTSLRPTSQWPWTAYQTDRLFLWRDKVFITLHQSWPPVAPPASLAWWQTGQTCVAYYPIPSQVQGPLRQGQTFLPPRQNASVLGIQWEEPLGNGWAFSRSQIALDNGVETSVAVLASTSPRDLPVDSFLLSRMTARLGAVVAKKALGPGVPLIFTESGWVVVGNPDEKSARLYRLPELGVAGRYTGAIALARGYVFTWETNFRGYEGPAGIVHVPFAVLAP